MKLLLIDDIVNIGDVKYHGDPQELTPTAINIDHIFCVTDAYHCEGITAITMDDKDGTMYYVPMTMDVFMKELFRYKEF